MNASRTEAGLHLAGAPGPVTEKDRIESLDILRGFAVLGILIMNIQSYAMPDSTYLNPTAMGNPQGTDYWVWLLSHIFADQKFMTIFSLLFGAGIVLMTSRREATGARSIGLHYRRMAALAFFGILHSYLIWDGDVLFFYGVCGFLVYPARKLSPRALILLGVLVISVGSGLGFLAGWSMPYWSEDQLKGFTESFWQPSPEKLSEEITIYKGTYIDQFLYRAPHAFWWHTFVFLFWALWRAGGLMLVGMGLFKAGVVTAKRSPKFYAWMVTAGACVGIPAIVYGVHRNFEAGWEVTYSAFLGSQYNYWASLIVSAGWIGFVMLACKTPRLSGVTRPFGPAGRMAFTNYILQSVFCTTIFYGWGFGFYADISRLGQIGIIICIWILQLVYSSIWLRHFRFGPLEWIWRSWSYGKPQPMLRRITGG